jgi:DNA-binding CsgD family transcriptional regulator
VALDEALAQHARLPLPFERARTLLVSGQVSRRRKQRHEAGEAFAEALEEFERIGTPLWAERARHELRRLGLRTEGDELTATERQVAELAASGLSNREIAERAFLSVKAVEGNLTRVYRKLEIHSRGGLARALEGAGKH